MSADVEKSIRCDCGCTIAQFDYWKWDKDDEDFNVDFYTVSKPTLKYRLKNVWAILRNRDPHNCIQGLVFSKPQIEQLREFCDEVLTETCGQSGKSNKPGAPAPG